MSSHAVRTRLTVLLLLTACGSSAATPVEEPPPSTVATTLGNAATIPSTTTTIVETPSTTAAPAIPIETAPPTTLSAEEAWKAIPIFSGGKGTFRTGTFEVPFTFTTSERWTRRAEAVLNFPDSPSYLAVGLGEESVATTIAAFQKNHDILGGQMSAAEDSSVGGAPGVVFETEGMPWEVSDSEGLSFLGEGRYVIGGERGLIHVVDVNGTAVLIAYYSWPQFFDVHLEAAQRVINSIAWKELS